MAKLYWRVKMTNKLGTKWTWIAADDENTIIIAPTVEAILMSKFADGTYKEFDKQEEEE